MTKDLRIQQKEVTCSHCLRPSREVLVCEWESSFSIHLIYFCIYCNKQIEIVRKDKESSPASVKVHS